MSDDPLTLILEELRALRREFDTHSSRVEMDITQIRLMVTDVLEDLRETRSVTISHTDSLSKLRNRLNELTQELEGILKGEIMGLRAHINTRNEREIETLRGRIEALETRPRPDA